jgi:hypothetical protein
MIFPITEPITRNRRRMTGIIRDNEKNNKIIRAIFHMTKYSLTITNIQSNSMEQVKLIMDDEL